MSGHCCLYKIVFLVKGSRKMLANMLRKKKKNKRYKKWLTSYMAFEENTIQRINTQEKTCAEMHIQQNFFFILFTVWSVEGLEAINSSCTEFNSDK